MGGILMELYSKAEEEKRRNAMKNIINLIDE